MIISFSWGVGTGRWVLPSTSAPQPTLFSAFKSEILNIIPSLRDHLNVSGPPECILWRKFCAAVHSSFPAWCLLLSRRFACEARLGSQPFLNSASLREFLCLYLFAVCSLSAVRCSSVEWKSKLSSVDLAPPPGLLACFCLSLGPVLLPLVS